MESFVREQICVDMFKLSNYYIKPHTLTFLKAWETISCVQNRKANFEEVYEELIHIFINFGCMAGKLRSFLREGRREAEMGLTCDDCCSGYKLYDFEKSTCSF